MKKLLFSLIAACAVFCIVGCESADTYGGVSGSASSNSVGPGGTVTLKASGWDSFVWTLSNADYGKLSSTVGREVKYTAADDVTNVTQTVTATAAGMPSNTNGAANYRVTFQIEHR